MKIIYITAFFTLSLIFISCGSSGSKNTAAGDEMSNSQDQGEIFKEDEQKQIYECDATKESEESFADTFVTYDINDIPYADSKKYSPLGVKDIEDIFNYARSMDPGVKNTVSMTLPPQEIWNVMDASQKVLYLVNSERCARGIRPFEGIDTTLENKVVKPYAEYISTHMSDFETNPHSADGKSVQQRIESSTDLKLGTNMTSLFENIATFAVGSSIGYQRVYESEAKAVYGWMYLDKKQNYGHRKSLLVTGLIDDSGEKGSEGIIASYTSDTNYTKDGMYYRRTFTVTDGVDPTSQWDNNLKNIKKVPLYR